MQGQNSTYRVMVHIGLKIAKRSTGRVKKCKRTLFLGHLWPICLKLDQSEFSRKIETPSLNG